MNKITLVLVVAMLSIVSTSAQIRVGKAILPYEQSFDNIDFKLNGAGIRQVLWIDMYVGALYTQEKSKDSKAILDSDESMSLSINVVSSFITQKKMIKAVKDGFQKATFNNTAALDERIEKFVRLFSDPIVKNDVFDFVYVKGLGLKAYKNDKELGVIEGRDFKYAFFKIWLGEDPVSESLKNGMLGIQ